ncbi:MAG: B12-binding domain-containing radical SAM protein, partial [Candidatus Omnitrophica bacterium]|nr:B12-binding domain-containing radical SAM protein [Candidatus Omnitrophota bacterium]
DFFLKKWTDRIIASESAVLCFSTYYSNYILSMLLAEALKKKDSSKIIIFGGPQASRHEKAQEFIAKDYIDLVVCGEGERTLVAIIEALNGERNFKDIKGIIYKINGEIFDNGTPDIEDIDKIPFPTFDGFLLEDYTKKMLPILASRGCINWCKFCAAKPLWSQYRFRKAESILEEMTYLKKRYNIEQFDILDALINGNIKELDRMCELLLAAKTKVYWGGKAVVRPEMTRKFLHKMYDAGCRWLSYGIESGSPRVIKAMGKTFDTKLAIRVLRDTCQAKIAVSTFFIVGFPGETRWDFIKTLWFIIRNRRHIGSISSGQKCGIPANSLLFREADKYGIRFENGDWYSPGNSPREREARHRIFKFVNQMMCLNIVHS